MSLTESYTLFLLSTGAVALFDLDDGERLMDLNWATSALAFNRDETRLAAGGTELVSIWDTTRYQTSEP